MKEVFPDPDSLVVVWYKNVEFNAFKLGGRPKVHMRHCTFAYHSDQAVHFEADGVEVYTLELQGPLPHLKCAVELQSGGIVAPNIDIAFEDFFGYDIQIIPDQIKAAKALAEQAKEAGDWFEVDTETFWQDVERLNDKTFAERRKQVGRMIDVE